MASIHDDEPESDIGYIFRVSGPRKDFRFVKKFYAPLIDKYFDVL